MALRKSTKKAQASMEYMMLFSFSLIIVGILWLLAGSNVEDSQWSLQLAYAKNSLTKISDTANAVYIQGSPAQMQISVDFPDDVNAVYIQNNSITLELTWKGILRNVTSYSIANMTGSINTGPGRHSISVQSGNPIQLSES